MKTVKGGRGGERKKTLRGCSKEKGEEKEGIEKKKEQKKLGKAILLLK